MIPVYNGSRTLQRCLESLAQQTRPADEVLVVNNASTDETIALVEKFIKEHPALPFRLLHESKKGAAAARNKALREIHTDIVAFTDADAWAPSDWLEKIEHVFTSQNCDAVGGMYRFWQPQTLAAQLQAMDLQMPPEMTGKIIRDKLQCLFGQMLGTCNAAYRKQALDAVQGFDENFHLTGEDMDLCMRVVEKGFKVLSWHPDVIIWHEPRPTLWLYWTRIFEYRYSLAALLKKHFRKHAVICLPFIQPLEFTFFTNLVVTKEFFLFIAMVAVCVFLFSWFSHVFLALCFFFLLCLLRFALRLSGRICEANFSCGPVRFVALILSDFIQKFFSEAGRLAGSWRERTLFL